MRIRQHVNPLGVHFEKFRGAKPRFVAGRPIEVEIGCADAQFLFERAVVDPDRTYVGLEIREDLVDLVNHKARKISAPVHAVFCQAQLHMPEIFGATVVDRVFVNFPDPWFKKKHHARRMVDATLVEGIAGIVRPSGEVFVQSDVWDIALDAMFVLESSGHFVNVAGEWSFWREGNPYGVRSWREQNAEETGLPIWRIMFRRS
ncbi:MAG: tRNA ((7)-)-methyltransferase [Myxococcales bacterium]|nr:tRNA ((7)-)-methyltransferase [Myxococcales bacterium]